jgi:hypothetical protein
MGIFLWFKHEKEIKDKRLITLHLHVIDTIAYFGQIFFEEKGFIVLDVTAR